MATSYVSLLLPIPIVFRDRQLPPCIVGDDRYQFVKLLTKLFRLVGGNLRGIPQLLLTTERMHPPQCEKYEVRSGNSYNLRIDLDLLA